MTEDNTGQVLKERYATLHHAVQLRDFAAYCERKAVLSREQLTSACENYTRFYTDEADQKHGVWNRTFGNLQDFGSLFWFAPNNIPNCYGPITIKFSRSIWEQCTDIALTKSNPGDEDYSLENDRLKTEDVEKCFKKAGRFWKLKEFGLELSVGNSELPLALASEITVEPVGDDLVERVKELFQRAGGDQSKVSLRDTTNSTDERRDTFPLLVEWARASAGELPVFSELPSVVPDNLQTWFAGIRDSHYAPLRQWLEYTYHGTIKK